MKIFLGEYLNETMAFIFGVLIYLTGKHEQNIRFDFVTNSIVRDIQSKDSKFFHINVMGCKNLQIQHVTITALGDSPNTDGIHIRRSLRSPSPMPKLELVTIPSPLVMEPKMLLLTK